MSLRPDGSRSTNSAQHLIVAYGSLNLPPLFPRSFTAALMIIVIAACVLAACADSSAADHARMTGVLHTLRTIAAAGLFAATYLAVALGRLPGSHLDRSGAAMAGAALMVGIGELSLGQARDAVDFNTLVLLLGMMIVVAHLRGAGFFMLINEWVVARAHRPLTLLILIVVVAGVLSAFLVNDAVCLVLTPLVLELVIRLRVHPTPYLLAIAMAANVGGVATLTGNPQNMIIGSLSHIPYVTFAAALAPVAIVGLVIVVAAIAIAYRSEFSAESFAGRRLNAASVPDGVVSGVSLASSEMGAQANGLNRPLIYKSMLVLSGTIIAFFFGVTPSIAAIVAGAILLITGGVGSKDIYREVDWTLLLMFGGLFIVVAGAQHALLTPRVIAGVVGLQLDHIPILATVTAILSNLVSNVPAVLVLKPFVDSLRNPQHAWLAVAMASTLAGNFTLLGSVANLIVVKRANEAGIEVSFWDYFKTGAPLTVITIVIGVCVIQLR